jgi:hypothetical protein
MGGYKLRNGRAHWFFEHGARSSAAGLIDVAGYATDLHHDMVADVTWLAASLCHAFRRL